MNIKGRRTSRVQSNSKLSRLDFLQALHRNQNYRRDARFLCKGKSMEELSEKLSEITLTQKRMKQANIWPPIPPSKLPELIKQELDTRQKDKPKDSAVTLVPAEVKTSLASLGKEMPDEWNYLRDGKFIRLEVDVTVTKDIIVAEMWEIIQEYQKMVRFKKGATLPPRRPQIKWTIYDRVYKIKEKPRSVLSLALEDLGLTNAPDTDDRNPAINTKLNSKARTYQRMLDEAESLIKAVYPIV